MRDGRYKEQKYRLSKCKLSNILYLVEGDLTHLETPEQNAVKQCIAETIVENKFFVFQTSSEKASVTLIQKVHFQFCEKLKGGSIDSSVICAFDAFTLLTSKNANLTVSDIFCKQLLAIKGATKEKVIAIVDKFKTPMQLMDAYNEQIIESSDPKKLKEMLDIDLINQKEEIQEQEEEQEEENPPKRRRKVGKTFSNRCYEYYCN